MSHEVVTRLGRCEPVRRGPGRAARANPVGSFAASCFPACLPRCCQEPVRRCHGGDLVVTVTSVLYRKQAEFSSFHFPGKKLDYQREFVCAESRSWPVVELGLEPSSPDAGKVVGERGVGSVCGRTRQDEVLSLPRKVPSVSAYSISHC